jgi:hypothetical protein
MVFECVVPDFHGHIAYSRMATRTVEECMEAVLAG